MIHRNRFLDYVERFRSQRILVVGPAVAEIDVSCEATHLAADRAMPVYECDSMSVHPGGAALTAATIRNLGGSATLLAPVGRGQPGQALRGVLDELGIELIEAGNGGAKTPELFRYLQNGRQLLQIRRGWQAGEFNDLGSTLRQISERAETSPPFDCICVVDGLPRALRSGDVVAIAEAARQWRVPVVFDAAGAMLVPPRGTIDHLLVNDAESRAIAHSLHRDDDDAESRLAALCDGCADTVVLTRGREGALFAHRDFTNEKKPTTSIVSIQTPSQPMSDRRGLGFVFSGVYALGIAAGTDADEAAFLACRAASIAAGTPGPKALRISDLLKVAYREIESQVADGIEVFGCIARDHLPDIDRAARLLMEAYTEGRQVLVFGNGGSAAEANHLVTELTGQFRRKRAAFPCISLSSNDALATCIANDYGFEDLFARQVEAYCKEGDVVIGMSTSGRSKNVIRGMEAARDRGARIIAFTGEQTGPMHDLADVILAVPSRSTPRIQEAHLFAIHVMCEMLDSRVNAEGQLDPAAPEI